ncbi:58abefe4-4841-42df-b4fb-ddbcfff1af2b-CDS [Sclerotinia trifoliorum]|uniref:58abefe4-4841-42df-b4fb-ddbcfff1af2b-CDS n=1 Tax=Sclerotinia trifoliorum TaxID=28548 RepID=A0A8H2VRN8_9HELO|nr:58abefe4-4841-42df-b4fb-ddbcfff1af2b-CDS [Sclerotinia trifoliorum]
MKAPDLVSVTPRMGYGTPNTLGFECVAGGEPCNLKWAPTSAEIATVLPSTLEVVICSKMKAILNRAVRDETDCSFHLDDVPYGLALILALFKAKAKGLNHS